MAHVIMSLPVEESVADFALESEPRGFEIPAAQLPAGPPGHACRWLPLRHLLLTGTRHSGDAGTGHGKGGGVGHLSSGAPWGLRAEDGQCRAIDGGLRGSCCSADRSQGATLAAGEDPVPVLLGSQGRPQVSRESCTHIGICWVTDPDPLHREF